ncbi:DUF6973 domain-containing protein [Candidatus Margulisiibacteriota bacterium]
MTNILTLKSEAEKESYIYFDLNIRELEKNSKGEINHFATGLVDNDVDAFRHAYTSGRYTQEHGEKWADRLGSLWELKGNSSSGNISDKNMDLWNNAVGRKYGKITKTKEELAKVLRKALGEGELIITPDDPRRYKGDTSNKLDPDKPVIVIKEKETGRNEIFFDTITGQVMDRKTFVDLIEAGQYPGYKIANIHNLPTPMSTPDSDPFNNLG